MSRFSSLFALPLCTALLLGGCGTGGPWPVLSAEIPDDADRIRETDPIVAEGPRDTGAVLTAEAFQAAQREVAAARVKYDEAVSAAKAEKDATERSVFIREAQIALTRANMAMTPLYSVADQAGGAPTAFAAEVRDYVTKISAWLQASQARLESPTL